MIHDDRRLIEDYLPIQAISAEASREKSVRKGHISTLHLWWARRPLVACRAAVYGALVPASQFVPACADKAGRPNGGSDAQKKSLGRANAAKFIERLCQYPGSPDVIKEAQEHILKAHAERLTRELRQTSTPVPLAARGAGGEGRGGEVGASSLPAWVKELNWPADNNSVTVEDIHAGRAPRPKVLDMFAGGGAIPLEALRLGCEAYALDLNPVAHIIQLCTLVYPQKFGKPDPNAKGSAKDGSWAGLAAEVEHWGKWVLEKVKAEIGDLYPPILDPQASGEELGGDPQGTMGFAEDLSACGAQAGPQQKPKVKRGFLTPVAYLWTRTVRCKNPACGSTVPLVKQTWLCKKKDRYVAMRVVAPKGEKRVRFEIVETHNESDLGFDPEAFSKAGNATCPFCGTVADSDYVKTEGCQQRIGSQLMSVACTRPGKSGKVYLSSDSFPAVTPSNSIVGGRLSELATRTGLTIPSEPIVNDAKNANFCMLYGLVKFSDLFTPRQLLCLLSFAEGIRKAELEMKQVGYEQERQCAVVIGLAAIFDRLADFNSAGCTWNYTGGRGVLHTMARQAIPMTWDFAETDPFNPAGASWVSGIEDVPAAFAELASIPYPAQVVRTSALQMPIESASLDAVITDPPYYDNVPYANVSDFFYVWLKRSIGHLYPEHFSSEGTPKKQEAVADAVRHGGDKKKAKEAYELMMAQAFTEACRVLKPMPVRNWRVERSCSDVQAEGVTIAAAAGTDFGYEEFLEDGALG